MIRNRTSLRFDVAFRNDSRSEISNRIRIKALDSRQGSDCGLKTYNLAVTMLSRCHLFNGLRRFSVQSKASRKVVNLVESFRDDIKLDDGFQAVLQSELQTEMNSLPRTKLSEILVAGGYYDVLEKDDYDNILIQLGRLEPIKEDKPSVTCNTKTFELMLRCGLIPNCSYSDFSPYSRRFLLRSRSRATDPNPSHPPSSFRTELRDLFEEVSSDFHKDIVIGPYYFDFIRLREPGVSMKPPSVDPDLKLLLKKYTCVNVVERSDLSPTGELKALAKIRSAIMRSLTSNHVDVYHADWEQLGVDNIKGKKIYLSSLVDSVK
jgi:hypothetical protein